MAYAQINYPQNLGTGPTVDTIADVGCFLTAFCNLLERYGESIDPPNLNNYFIAHGSYLPDGPDKDNLGWGSVAAYDGNIVPSQIGGAGWPDSNEAIVKFIYKSKRSNKEITHFCLCADVANGIIVDSWDGQIKHSPYGTPVAWAKYEKHQPQVVAPPPPPETPAFTVENIDLRIEELKVDTHLWDLSQRSWPGLVNNPVNAESAGKQFETNAIAHHLLGGSYYMPTGNGSQGYNIVDCEVAPAEPTPPPAPIPPPAAPQTFTKNVVDGITFEVMPDAPKPMYINKPGGAEKWKFKNVTTWREFTSVEHLDYGTQVFVVGSALHPIPPSGAMYYMVDQDFGDFKRTGNITNQLGINRIDLSDTKPPALPEPVPAPVVTTPVAPPVVPVPPATRIETPAVDSTAPINWKDTYRPFPKAIHYIATRKLTVSDLNDDNKQSDMPLPKYDDSGAQEIGVVSAYGTVAKNGIEYYRLKTNNDPSFAFWYCIPKIDPDTHTPNLLVKPVEVTTPISKVTVARDGLALGRSKIETELGEFFDILPKWLKTKK